MYFCKINGIENVVPVWSQCHRKKTETSRRTPKLIVWGIIYVTHMFTEERDDGGEEEEEDDEWKKVNRLGLASDSKTSQNKNDDNCVYKVTKNGVAYKRQTHHSFSRQLLHKTLSERVISASLPAHNCLKLCILLVSLVDYSIVCSCVCVDFFSVSVVRVRKIVAQLNECKKTTR